MSNYSLNDKLNNYKKYADDAKEWFEDNFDKITQLFEDKTVKDFVFEPFLEVFTIPDKTIDQDIYAIITQVAIINAVLAGIPGQMGIGVYVSMALEGWMAYAIAQHVGVKVGKPSDIFKYFGLLAGVGFTILFGFKHILSFAFSMVSVIPGLNPLILAELMVTNFVGVLFWVGFKEVKATGSFSIPMKLLMEIGTQTKNIFTYQFQVLKTLLTTKNITLFASRLKKWFTGDLSVDKKVLNGELFSSAAMLYLIQEEYDKLDGPLGEVFLDAIRLRWSSQFDDNTSIEEISEYFQGYSAESLEGAINTIKGKMFEIMVVNAENSDTDEWKAYMHDDESYPGSDIIFLNDETGEEIEVSLKAVSENSKSIIEQALDKYPEFPIMTTDEMATLYGDDSRIFGSGISNEELHDITEENIDKLIDSIHQVDTNTVVIGGVTVGLVAAIWPFTMAYLKKNITYEQFEAVLVKIVGDNGVKLASRLSYAVLLGPIFAWYLLARGVGAAVQSATDLKTQYKLEVIY